MASPPQQGAATAQRLALANFDPRTLYPNPQNLVLVQNHLSQVELQLGRDREWMHNDPGNAAAREARNESLQYFGILLDWTEAARHAITVASNLASTATRKRPGMRMNQARESLFPVRTFEGGPAENRLCYYDVQRDVYFIFVKNIRDSIYGGVVMAQVAKMENNVVVPRDLEQGKVAIKVYDKSLVNARQSRGGVRVQEDPMRELSIQQTLSDPGHRYVMPLLAVLETSDKIFAILPFVQGGELFDHVSVRALRASAH
jgi:hypothetical protein